MPECWGNGRCDPTGIWGGYGRIVLMALIAAAALAAVGTALYVLDKPAPYWALPLGFAVLSGGLYFAWKISVYRNSHLIGEKFQIFGCSIACLSDPHTPSTTSMENRYVSSPPICLCSSP